MTTSRCFIHAHVLWIMCAIEFHGHQWYNKSYTVKVSVVSRTHLVVTHVQIVSDRGQLDVITIAVWPSVAFYMLSKLNIGWWNGLSLWRHQMETFSALLPLCEGNPAVIGGFPSQRPMTRSFDVFFGLRLNKRLSKQSRIRWYGTPSRLLWRHCNGYLNKFWLIVYKSLGDTSQCIFHGNASTTFIALYLKNNILNGNQFFRSK